MSKPAFDPNKPFEPAGAAPAAPAAKPAFDPAKTFTPAEQSTGPSAFESTLRGLAQGATFGFADELAGAAEVIGGGSYEKGRDASRAAFAAAEKANPKAFVGGAVGGGLLTAFVPGLGWLSAGKTAAQAAATGAAAGALGGLGASTAQTPGGVVADVGKGAAIGGVLGGAVGGVLQAVSRARLPEQGKQILMNAGLDAVAAGHPQSPAAREAMEKFLAEGDNSLRIYDTATRKLEALSPEQLKFPEGKLSSDYRNYLLRQPAGVKLSREANKKAADLLAGMLPGEKESHWRGYQTHLAQAEATQEIVDQLAQAGTKIKDPLGLSAFRKMQDPMFTAREIDNVTGLNFEGAVGQAAQAGRTMTLDAAPFVARKADLVKASEAAFGKDLTKVGRYLNDSAGVDKLNPAQQQVVAGWRSLLEDTRLKFRERGLNVEKLEGDYLPMQEVAASDKYTALKTKITEMKRNQGGYRPGVDEDLDNALLRLNGGKTPRSTQQIDQLLESVLAPEVLKTRPGSEAGATFQRTGDTPDFIRNWNPSEVYNNYLMGNLKAIHMRPVYDQLHSNISMARGLGLENSADYFQKYFSRISGEPSSWYAYMQYASNKWKAHWDDVLRNGELGPIQQRLGEAAKAVPDMLSWASTAIYPNLLGWNMYAPIRNMSQTWVTTAPELGGQWGLRSTARGWLKAAQARRSGDTMSNFLRQRGLQGAEAEVLGEASERAITSGMSKIPGLAQVAGGIDKMGQLGMTFFTMSDTANRYISYHIGQEVAKDLLSGSAGDAGRKFLERLPAGMKADVRTILRSKNTDQLGDMLGKYLIRKTQFDYGKANLNQFGQDYGRLLSMFMKWPSVILSDVHELAKTRQGMDKLRAPLMRYGAPLALLAAGQQFLTETKATKSPMAKLALGNSLVQWAPGSAVLGLERPPPLIAAGASAIGAANSLVSGELKEAGSKIHKAFAPFIPGYGAVHATKQRIQRAFEE